MIDGLKLTMPGEVLKAKVAKRIRQHETAVERYRADLKMDPKDQTDEHPLLRLDRIAALTLIYDHSECWSEQSGNSGRTTPGPGESTLAA